jgi:hypothetical protein
MATGVVEVLAGRAALHGRREQHLGSVSPQWLTEHQQRTVV